MARTDACSSVVEFWQTSVLQDVHSGQQLNETQERLPKQVSELPYNETDDATKIRCLLILFLRVRVLAAAPSLEVSPVSFISYSDIAFFILLGCTVHEAICTWLVRSGEIALVAVVSVIVHILSSNYM